MTTIVVLADFTDNANNAARYAADMAASIGAELHLVHVLQVPANPRLQPIPDDALEELRDRGLGSLKTLADELIKRTKGTVNIATDQETGQLESRVWDFCQWKKPFLVVRGSPHSGQHSFDKLPFPLLTIPAAIRYQPVHTILLACDREDIHEGLPVSIAYLRQLRDFFRARFEILHVTTKEEQAGGIEFSDWKRNLVKQFPEMVHFIRAVGVEEGMAEYLRHQSADWLVVFPKKSGILHLHKSLSQNIILHCPLPTISLHE